jgi:putative membrane protein
MDQITADKPGKRIERSKPNATGPKRFSVQMSVTEHFAWLRTRLAIERTLMAWLRTATALIAFGFAIVKIFQWLQRHAPDKPVLLPNGSRDFGLTMIGAGIVGSIIALRQYRFAVRYMWSDEFRSIAGIGDKPFNTPLFAMGILITAIGVVAFATVLFRLS